MSSRAEADPHTNSFAIRGLSVAPGGSDAFKPAAYA